MALIADSGMGKSWLLKAIQLSIDRLHQPRRPVYVNISRDLFTLDDYYAELCEQIGIPVSSGGFFSRNLRDQRILLLLDEIERLAEPWFTSAVREQLRALSTGWDSPLKLIIAARTNLNTLFNDSSLGSPFENICQYYPLEPWTDELIESYIEQHLQNAPIQFSNPEKRDIIKNSGGVPSKVRELCYECYERYRD